MDEPNDSRSAEPHDRAALASPAGLLSGCGELPGGGGCRSGCWRCPVVYVIHDLTTGYPGFVTRTLRSPITI